MANGFNDQHDICELFKFSSTVSHFYFLDDNFLYESLFAFEILIKFYLEQLVFLEKLNT